MDEIKTDKYRLQKQSQYDGCTYYAVYSLHSGKESFLCQFCTTAKRKRKVLEHLHDFLNSDADTYRLRRITGSR